MQEMFITLNIIYMGFCVFNWFFLMGKGQLYNLYFIHLVMVIVIDFFKELVYGFLSLINDWKLNHRKYVIFKDEKLKKVNSQELSVGNVIVLEEGELAPVDMIVLRVESSSN